MGKKVLVVDDERLIVKGIKFSLVQDDMEVDCAYDGEDIKYVYDDFTLVTYTEKKGGTEYVQSIKFTSKKAKTKEGIKIGSKEKTMKKKYGRARDNFGVYTYKKGKMGITFTVDDGKVSAIQYVAY